MEKKSKKSKKGLKEGVVSAYIGIENTVVRGYKAIENGVVGGYKAVEDATVGAYKSVEDTAKYMGRSLVEEYNRQKSKSNKE